MTVDPLVIATGNRHKFDEIAAFLDGVSCHLSTLADHPPNEAPLEDGTTFEENAVLKARYYAARLGLACVADDSGLVVEALGGEPGIYSARYAGSGCTDADNNAKLLAALRDVPEDRRQAKFVCCAALATPEGIVHVETGTVKGRIAFAPRGEDGFGYDPLFIPEGLDRTFAELGPSVKARMSHRSRAFGKMRAYLESLV